MQKIIKICDLCGKDLSINSHSHLLESIPSEDAVYLCTVWQKTNVRRVCCSHFNDHEMIFKFTAKNYPGVKKILV